MREEKNGCCGHQQARAAKQGEALAAGGKRGLEHGALAGLGLRTRRQACRINLGQLLGARFGSKLVMKRGAKIIRPLFIVVVLGLTGKLLYDAFLK